MRVRFHSEIKNHNFNPPQRTYNKKNKLLDETVFLRLTQIYSSPNKIKLKN